MAFFDEPSNFYYSFAEDATNSTDRVISQYRINSSLNFSTTTSVSASIVSSGVIYYDVHSNAYDQISSAERGPDMVSALLVMTSSTENYVPAFFKSAPCGNDYNDNTVIGTDSIAFGGLTH